MAGLLEKLLSNKPLSDWQKQQVELAGNCPECDSPLTVTAPISDNEEMVRMACENCGWSEYKFKPTIISFSDLSKS